MSADQTALKTPEERWWVVRAGEYVLGTLRGRDLELFERILAHDTGMQREVERWEQRLAGLNEHAAPRQPAAHVWPNIVERIRQVQPAQPVVDQPLPGAAASAEQQQGRQAASEPAAAAVPSRIGSVGRQFSLLWPSIAAVATVASLLMGILVQQQAVELDGSFQLDGVSVVETDADGTALFVVETDYENEKVRIVALSPPAIEEEQNLQLWQALPPGEEGVRPVALLPTTPGASRSYDVSTLIENSELFGVSIEPAGAPTDGGPTGPVIAHGSFIKAGHSEAGNGGAGDDGTSGEPGADSPPE